jgi:quinol monooxygenase YgiN
VLYCADPTKEVVMIRRTPLAVASLVFVLFAGGLASTQTTEAPYIEGPVWNISFIRTTYGLEDDYLKSLAQTYKKIMEEAKKQNLVLSYHVISANAVNGDDWNLLLMVEYKNMAALDGLDAKFRAIQAKIVGNEDAQRNLMVKRLEVRKVLGDKLGRELFLK